MTVFPFHGLGNRGKEWLGKAAQLGRPPTGPLTTLYSERETCGVWQNQLRQNSLSGLTLFQIIPKTARIVVLRTTGSQMDQMTVFLEKSFLCSQIRESLDETGIHQTLPAGSLRPRHALNPKGGAGENASPSLLCFGMLRDTAWETLGEEVGQNICRSSDFKKYQ